jgi:hypothetical protein
MSDYARLVNEAANALADLIVRVLDGLVLEPIRAVDDALDSSDREDDFERKEETS